MRSTSVKTIAPAQYHNIQSNNHDDNLTITPYSCKVPFVIQCFLTLSLDSSLEPGGGQDRYVADENAGI